MEDVDLKPCPFDSGQARFMHRYKGPILEYVVRCYDCNAATGYYGDADEAGEAWNRRADGWIPVSERLPDEGRSVLWLEKSHGLPYEQREIRSGKLGYDGKDGPIVWQGLDGNFCYLLHRFSDWQPLPAAPGGER